MDPSVNTLVCGTQKETLKKLFPGHSNPEHQAQGVHHSVAYFLSLETTWLHWQVTDAVYIPESYAAARKISVDKYQQDWTKTQVEEEKDQYAPA